MAETPPFDENAERRRRVEALFAEEPYLSPTMRARQLQDKQPRTDTGDWGTPPVRPVERPPLRIETVAPAPASAPLRSEPPASSVPDERISLADARARLQTAKQAVYDAVPGSEQAAVMTKLLQFRRQVLERWIQEMYQ